jgi:hypothetical protein
LVAIEVGLLNTAVFEGDVAIERRDAEDDPSLDLRANSIGIDDGSAIDRPHDAPNTNRAILRSFNFGNLRHIGCKGELDGEALKLPTRL